MRQESKCKGKWHVTWKSSSVPIHLNPDQTSLAVTLHLVKLSSSPSAFCLSGKSSSALRSSLLLCMCVTRPKYSLSYWRPVQPVPCLSDVFTTLCPTSPWLSLRQGKFCLLRHCVCYFHIPIQLQHCSVLTYTSELPSASWRHPHVAA